MNIQLTCSIIDDEPLAVKLLQSYVEKTPFLKLVACYASAIEATSEIQENPVDLIFTDIQMPDLNGIDFAQMVPPTTRIIFTTAFSQYAIDSYKVDALDYLLKPFSYTDFLKATQKAVNWFRLNRKATANEDSASEEKQSEYIFVKSEYKLVRVRFDDILFIEGLKDYIKIYLEEGKPLLSLTPMHSVEEALPSDTFFRTHRSFIVNMDKVSVVERSQIVFDNKHIPISDRYKDKVLDTINQHLLTREKKNYGTEE